MEEHLVGAFLRRMSVLRTPRAVVRRFRPALGIALAALLVVFAATAGLATPALAAGAHASTNHSAQARQTITYTGECANGTPAITHLYVGNTNYLFIVWVGCDSAHHLNVEGSADGYSWGTCGWICSKWTLSDTSENLLGVAATSWNQCLYISWVGTDQHLNLGCYNWSSTLQSKVTLPDTATFTPAIATYLTYGSYVLYLAWAGTDSARHLNFEHTSDGFTFTGKVTGNDTAAAGPAIQEWPTSPGGDTLWVAWMGTNSSHQIYTGEFTGSSTLAYHNGMSSCSSTGCIGVDTTGDVGLVVGNDSHLYVSAYSDTTGALFNEANSSAIILAGTSNGSSFNFVQTASNNLPQYNWGPSATYFYPDIWQAWAGNGAGGTHWYPSASLYQP